MYSAINSFSRIPAGTPTDCQYKQTVEQAYKKKQDGRNDVGDYKYDADMSNDDVAVYVKPRTANQKGEVIFAIRGLNLKAPDDLKSLPNIITANFEKSARFRSDKAQVLKAQSKYTQGEYDHYFTGHSLGGAVAVYLQKDNETRSNVSGQVGTVFNAAVGNKASTEPLDRFKRYYHVCDPVYSIENTICTYRIPFAQQGSIRSPGEIIIDPRTGVNKLTNDNLFGIFRKCHPMDVDAHALANFNCLCDGNCSNTLDYNMPTRDFCDKSNDVKGCRMYETDPTFPRYSIFKEICNAGQ